MKRDRKITASGEIPFRLTITKHVEDSIIIGGGDGTVGKWLDSLIEGQVSMGESLSDVTVDLTELFEHLEKEDPTWDEQNRSGKR